MHNLLIIITRISILNYYTTHTNIDIVIVVVQTVHRLRNKWKLVVIALEKTI